MISKNGKKDRKNGKKYFTNIRLHGKIYERFAGKELTAVTAQATIRSVIIGYPAGGEAPSGSLATCKTSPSAAQRGPDRITPRRFALFCPISRSLDVN